MWVCLTCKHVGNVKIKEVGQKVVSIRPHFAHGEAHTSEGEQGP